MRYRPKGSDPDDPRLGRFLPDDWKHVEKYPLTAVLPTTVDSVERVLSLPGWHWTHDQGSEGSCVGHGSVMERAIVNLTQRAAARKKPYTRRYDPIDLWDRAKLADSFPETQPGDQNGTTVRAAYDVLRNSGPRLIRTNGIQISHETGMPEVLDHRQSPDLAEGVVSTRWAKTVDELRTGLSRGVPAVIGVNWYEAFDKWTTPSASATTNNEAWTGTGNLGRIRGGHCVCVYGASDKRQAFRIKNSWGRAYPLVWMPYPVMQRLLTEDGEAAISTDR